MLGIFLHSQTNIFLIHWNRSLNFYKVSLNNVLTVYRLSQVTQYKTLHNAFLTLRIKSGGVPGRTDGLRTPSWWEWINVSSRSKTRIFRFTASAKTCTHTLTRTWCIYTNSCVTVCDPFRAVENSTAKQSLALHVNQQLPIQFSIDCCIS